MKRLPIPALVTGLLSLALPAAHANYGFFSNEGSIVMVDRGGPGQTSLFLSPVGWGSSSSSSGSSLSMVGMYYSGNYNDATYSPALPEQLDGFHILRPFGFPSYANETAEDYRLLDASHNPNAFALYDLTSTLPLVARTSGATGGTETPSLVADESWHEELAALQVSYSVVLESEFPANEYSILSMNNGAKPLADPGLLGGALLNAGPEAYVGAASGATPSSSAPSLDPIVIGGLGGFNPNRVDSTVPEPSSAILLAISLGALRFIVRKKA